MFDNHLQQDQFRARASAKTLGDREEELERIPIITKISPVADTMNTSEIQTMLGQYSQLCKLYVDALCELARRCKLSPFEVVKAWQVYEPYIRDVAEQIDRTVALFTMENELRSIKGQGRFTVPTVTPHGRSIENPTQTKAFLEELDKEIVEILQEVTAREAEYDRERARACVFQTPATTHQSNRPEYSFLSMNQQTSTPIRSTNRTTYGIMTNTAQQATNIQNRPPSRNIQFDPTQHTIRTQQLTQPVTQVGTILQ